MSSIGSLASSITALALLAAPQGPPGFCDPELLHAPKSPTSYQVRGDRCEGIYAQQVSTVNLDLRSFEKGFGAFDPEKETFLDLTWRAPAGVVQNARLRAFSLKSRVYFRMDTAQSAAAGMYRWPTDILAGEGLGRDGLGILAWIEMPGPATREIYLPLRAGKPQASDGYDVVLVPSKKLRRLLFTVIQIDGQGNKVRDTTVTNREAGGDLAYYASNEPTLLSMGKLGPPGYYRLLVTATAASGESVIKEIDFYHSGD